MCPGRIWQHSPSEAGYLASEITNWMEIPLLQSSTAREAAVGVVAGDLVIGIAEQPGAANRVHANIVAADHGVHWDLEWGATAGQRTTVI
jgi:hypothetical protein